LGEGRLFTSLGSWFDRSKSTSQAPGILASTALGTFVDFSALLDSQTSFERGLLHLSFNVEENTQYVQFFSLIIQLKQSDTHFTWEKHRLRHQKVSSMFA